MEIPRQQIRAVFDERTITVYQAYSPEIAEPAVRAGRFVPPFKRDRMTWIKPSFLWMMYRCGWATKPGQERVLAISITRAGFDWALENACLSHYDRAVHADRASWWITGITEVTALAHEIHELVRAGRDATGLLPRERPYQSR